MFRILLNFDRNDFYMYIVYMYLDSIIQYMLIYKYVELAYYICINGISSVRGLSQYANVADMWLGRLNWTLLLAVWYSVWDFTNGNLCKLFSKRHWIIISISYAIDWQSTKSALRIKVVWFTIILNNEKVLS